jgi:hypothetical protein
MNLRFEPRDHSFVVWSLDKCRSTAPPGLAVLTWPMPTGAIIIKETGNQQ